SAVNAAYSREGAEHYIDDGFEHGARSRRSTALRLLWMHLLQSPGYGPVAAPASGDLAARFFRESHMSLWALMNCRSPGGLKSSRVPPVAKCWMNALPMA